ncbi:molybdopterin molybdotransferase MoeA [Marinibacterium profundimaris]|uniref:Molybdopterin molybdenumtransferase n=1 Tax=Marinibacterium profundimaris TaxID=1679460 RepID=A0A225NLY1_9RHOB|nr:gephyrin-like molybdotransferase Glp [Marinibacterium profundimaris]OWU75056.1 molybdenum cofactor biosynthesis protein MoaA [Marinibacterium profundimaris]
MIPVGEAMEKLFSLVEPVEIEQIDLADACGRVLAEPVAARRDQPPFPASSMDGYAIKAVEAMRDAQFRVVGESAAGRRFEGRVGPGQAVRIFTGAPVPEGADHVVIQEDVRRDGALISLLDEPGDKDNIRPAGTDFRVGATLEAPRRLGPSDIALLAAMNIPLVPVRRQPEIALISTGDELVQPGEDPGPDQIMVSNTYGLKAMLDLAGASVRMLPIARDTAASLRTAFELARGADLVVTIGGASVGDYDLVGDVAAELGMEQSFYKVAMRPGKPLMAGHISGSAMVGLPGNPVSALVCGEVFLRPMLNKMLGLGASAPARLQAPLSQPLLANGPREHYMRATLDAAGIHAFDRQDSSLLSVLTKANALLVRPPHDSAREVGEMVDYIPL